MISRTLVNLALAAQMLCLPLYAQGAGAKLPGIPKAMQSQAPNLESMLNRVDVAAKGLGLKEWPDPTWRDKYEPPSEALKSLSPLIRKVWANDQVLWVRIEKESRWDALLLMKDINSNNESAPLKMVWLKDAFNACELKIVLPNDGWGSADVFSWGTPKRTIYCFYETKTQQDIRSLWALNTDGKRCYLACAPPESDAGLRLAYHPTLGIAYQVDDVDQEADGDGSMGTILKPDQFKRAKVIKKDGVRVWFESPVWQGDSKAILCVADKLAFNSWSKKLQLGR